jgi:hypothetical protein
VDDRNWQRARLIPVSGIKGDEEKERRGASAVLAVIQSVKEFGRAITQQAGAPAGQISTFIEVPFELNGQQFRPDGLIQVARGKRLWTALVEVKTGRNNLETEQLERYIDIARERQFDAVLTISNQLVTVPGEHPTPVDKKKLRKVQLHHLSWSQIRTEAAIERTNSSVADQDQSWILAEFIRYLEHPQSGALEFDDMGRSWVTVRDAVASRTLRASDPGAAEVVAHYGQLIAFAGMTLSVRLGVDVRPALSRSQMRDVGTLIQSGVTTLVEDGVLLGSLRVPNAPADISVRADLRSSKVTCAMSINAPTQGRNKTRINWLVRQLSRAPGTVLIESSSAWARSRGPCHSLAAVRESPELVVEDAKRELKSFTIQLSSPAGTKRGQGRGSFVESVLTLIGTFYEDVVQHVNAWKPPTPALKARHVDDDQLVAGTDITQELPTSSISPTSEPEAGWSDGYPASTSTKLPVAAYHNPSAAVVGEDGDGQTDTRDAQ